MQCSDYLLLHNRPPKIQYLKTTAVIYLAHELVSWTELGGNGSSLLYVALAGVSYVRAAGSTFKWVIPMVKKIVLALD